MGLLNWFCGKRGKSSAEPQVHCQRHGTTRPAFVCSHARDGSALGFYVASTPSPEDHADDPFDDCLNGGCEECESKRLECGGWNDESERFCGVTLVCTVCFEEIRHRNTTGNEKT